MARSQKVWVRRATQFKTIIGTSADTVSVLGIRDTSAVASAQGQTSIIDGEFTVVRFIGHYSCENLDTAAAITTNPPPFILGGRVAGTEELEELQADANFAAESGPLQNPMDDWMFWVPAHPANAIGVSGTTEIFVGKGMFDIRSARRVDGRREDFAVFLQGNVSSLATTTQSVRLSWAALCVVP